jgi:hypothetical protein
MKELISDFVYFLYFFIYKIDTPPGTSDEHITLVEQIKALFPNSKFSSILVTTPQVINDIIIL